MRYPWMYAILALIAICCLPANLAARTPAAVTVIQVGVSAVAENDRDGARQAAIQDALRAAVDRVLVDLMPEDALVGHFKTLDRMVAARYGDHVSSFKLLTESASEGRFRVLVQATVSTAGLRRQVAASGIAIDKKPLPRVLLYLSETTDDMGPQRYWWQPEGAATPAMIDAIVSGPLSAKGYTVADPARPAKGRSPKLPDVPDLDLASARSAAKNYRADVLVLGSASARMSSNTMGQELKTYKGSVTLRAYRVSNGELLAEATSEKFASGVNDAMGTRDALTESGYAAGQDLAEKIAAAWLSAGGAITRVEVDAEGSNEIIDYVMFRRALKKMPGVKAIQTRTMRPGRAKFIVDFQGRVKAFAQGMMHNEFDRFRLDIFDVETGSLKVQLIPR